MLLAYYNVSVQINRKKLL